MNYVIDTQYCYTCNFVHHIYIDFTRTDSVKNIFDEMHLPSTEFKSIRFTKSLLLRDRIFGKPTTLENTVSLMFYCFTFLLGIYRHPTPDILVLS